MILETKYKGMVSLGNLTPSRREEMYIMVKQEHLDKINEYLSKGWYLLNNKFIDSPDSGVHHRQVIVQYDSEERTDAVKTV